MNKNKPVIRKHDVIKGKKAVQEMMDTSGIPNIEKEFEEYKRNIEFSGIKIVPKKKDKKKTEEEILFEEFLKEYGYYQEVKEKIDMSKIRIVRKEVISEAPLYKVSIYNKIKIAVKEYMRITGHTERKQSEKLRKEEEKKLKIERNILTKLQKILKSQIEKNTKECFISIDIPSDRVKYLNNVLQNDYFSQFKSIEEVPRNENYLVYNVKLPIVLKFTLDEERSF